MQTAGGCYSIVVAADSEYHGMDSSDRLLYNSPMWAEADCQLLDKGTNIFRKDYIILSIHEEFSIHLFVLCGLESAKIRPMHTDTHGESDYDDEALSVRI